MKNGLFALVNLLCLVCVIYDHLPTEGYGLLLGRMTKLVIPLFSMIAGYSWGNVLRKTGGAGVFSGLKLFLVPYCFWSVAYYVVNNVILDVFIRHQAYEIPSISDVLMLVVTGSAALHLWFLVYLVYAILISTIIYRLCGSVKVKFAIYSVLAFLTLVFSAADVVSEGQTFLRHVWKWGCWLMPNFFFGLLFSVKAAKYYEHADNKKLVLVVLGTAGIFSLSFFNGRGAETILAIAILTVCLLYPRVKMPKFIQTSMEYSMGIYLVHAFYAAAFSMMASALEAKCFTSPLGWGVAVFIYALSMLTVIAMRKVSFLRNFV